MRFVGTNNTKKDGSKGAMQFRLVGILAALVVASCETGSSSLQFASPAPKSQAPQVEVLPPASLRLIRDASISRQHYAVEGLDLPSEGIEVTLSCRVDRTNGRPWLCVVPDRSPPLDVRLAAAAQRRIDEMWFDSSLLRPEDTSRAMADITVRLSPNDRRVLSPPANVRPQSDVIWKRQPSEEAIESALWTPWRTGIETNHIEARMRCQIQTDLSVICADLRLIPDKVAPTQVSALRLGADYISAEKLADGSPAESAWVEIAVAADEPPIAIAAPPPRRQ